MAIVVGPTPPTRGVIQPATVLARLVDVGEQLASLVANPGSHHDATRADVLGLDHAGNPSGCDEDVRTAGVVGPVGHAGVHHGHGRVGRRALL